MRRARITSYAEGSDELCEGTLSRKPSEAKREAMRTKRRASSLTAVRLGRRRVRGRTNVPHDIARRVLDGGRPRRPREHEAVDVGVEVVRQLRHDEALVEADLIDRRGPAPPGPASSPS